jgi:uncharacterized protein
MPTIEEAKTWYPANDPVHGFDHVLRVMRMAEKIGQELGANLTILQAAALLHDAEGAHPSGSSGRGEHEQSSAAFARRILETEGWTGEAIEAVEHCIRAHRFRGKEQPQTLEARVLFDADKLDVLGAFGVARTIGYALQDGQPIYTKPSEEFRERGEAAPGEPHSAYHEYLFKLRHVKARLYTAPAKKIAEGRHALLCSYFDQLAAEAQDED